MKIRYINEAFKKISNLKKDSDKVSTDEEFRKDTLRSIVLDVIHDETFQERCSGSINKVIEPGCDADAYASFPGIMEFEYSGEKNGIVYLTGNVFYFNPYTSRDKPLTTLFINDDIVKDTSIDDIRKYIEDYIKIEFYNAGNKIGYSNIKKSVSNIHINKINLWKNAPGNIEGAFYKQVLFYFKSERRYQNGDLQIISDKDAIQILEKLNEIFDFSYMYECNLYKTYINIKLEKEEIDNNLDIQELKNNFKNKENFYKHDKNFMLCKKYIGSSKKYNISIVPAIADINKLLKYKQMEKSIISIITSYFGYSRNILTTTALDNLIENKNYLCKICFNREVKGTQSEMEPFKKNVEFFVLVDFRKSSSSSKNNIYTLYPYIYGISKEPFTI